MDVNELKAMLAKEAKEANKNKREEKTGMKPLKGGPNKIYNFE